MERKVTNSMTRALEIDREGVQNKSMENEKLIKLGQVRQKVYQDSESEDKALEYIGLLTTEMELLEEFMKNAVIMREKFSESIKILFTIGRHSQFMLEAMKGQRKKEIKKILEDAKKISSESYDRILKLEPSDDTDLRMKLLVIRQKEQHEKALEEIDRYEQKHGRDSQTIMMRADYHYFKKEGDKIEAIIPEIEKIDDEFKHSAIAYLNIYSQMDSGKQSEIAMRNILKSIEEKPELDFSFSILNLYCEHMKPIPSIMREILRETLKTKRSMALLSNIMGLFIRFTIFFPDDEVFRELILKAHPLDIPVITTLSALCMHFDNYGMARYIMNSWSDRNASMSPQFAIFVSTVAKEMAEKCNSGIGIRPVKSKDAKKRIARLKADLISASINALRRYTTLAPDDPSAHLQMAMRLVEFNQKEKAFEFFEKANKLDKSNQLAKFNIAMIKKESGENIEAYELFREIIKEKMVKPEITVESMIQASEIAIRFGWIKEGESFLGAAKAIMPFDERVTTKLAKIYLKEAKIIGSEFALEKAEEQLEISVSHDPKNIEAMYYLSHVRYMKHEYLMAIRNLLKVSQYDSPFKMLSYFWISRSYYQLYKNLLFSKREYLKTAIEYATKLEKLTDHLPLVSEYIMHLNNEACIKQMSGLIDEEKDYCKVDPEAIRIQKEKRETIVDKIKKADKFDKAGEVKVLAVFAPQMNIINENEINDPKRYFSIGSVGCIEVSYLPGNGGYQVTGNLGDSFKNSIKVAYTYFVRYLQTHNLQPDLDKTMNIHVPGWIPKYDGPSAGLPISVAMISAYTGTPLPKIITMTGEVTSMGKVRTVGGIKEKIEATKEKGVDTIIIPADNKWDYLDMLLKREEIKGEDIKIPEVIDVETVDQVVEMFGIGLKDS